MTDNFPEILQTKLTKLHQCLDVSIIFVAQLYQDGVILWGEKQQLDAKPTDQEKVDKLIGILNRKTRRQYDLFLKALKDAGQGHVRNILVRAEAEYLAREEQPQDTVHQGQGSRSGRHASFSDGTEMAGATRQPRLEASGFSNVRSVLGTNQQTPSVPINIRVPSSTEHRQITAVHSVPSHVDDVDHYQDRLLESNSGNAPVPCRMDCGFYGTAATEWMCSQCYRRTPKRKQRNRSPPPAVDGRASPPGKRRALPHGSQGERSSNRSSNAVPEAPGSPGQQTPVATPPPSGEQMSPQPNLIREYEPVVPPLATYAIDADNPGLVVIINNNNFHDPRQEQCPYTERRGSDIDVTKIQCLFISLNFEVRTYENLDENDTLELIVRLKRDQSLVDKSSLIMLVMSHGGNGDSFITADCREVQFSHITKSLDIGGCPALKFKPKMFIFEACRGQQANTGVTRDVPEVNVVGNGTNPTTFPLDMDCVFAYATTAGFYAFLNPNQGSWYINAICEVFRQDADREHVLDMLARVNQAVSLRGAPDQKQMPEPRYTLTKRWYLTGPPH